MSNKPILVISGTNRPNANALRIAKILHGHYTAAEIPAEIYSLADMPKEIFAGDAYAQKPEAFVSVQQRVVDAAGLHIVTPEYNGTFPGVLKYFIDMLKFPDSFVNKPVAFVGEANGMWGGLRSVEQLQMIFSYRNAYSYPDRVFIPAVSQKLDVEGQLTDDDINTRLKKQALGFCKFAQCVRDSVVV